MTPPDREALERIVGAVLDGSSAQQDLPVVAAGSFGEVGWHGRQVRRRIRSPLQMLRDEKGGGVDSRSHSRIRPVPS
jgi:hypothetical protein